MKEIVIKLTDQCYKRVVDYKENLPVQILEAIRHGVVLPKGHGRLIDADWVLNKMSTTDAQPITPNEHYAWNFAKTLLRKTPTSIEADKKNKK